jgi:hypothetical protein
MPQLAENAGIKWPVPPEPVRKVGRLGKAKARKRRKDPNAAAIDIGCSEHWVCVPAGRAAQSVQAFGCCTAELNRMADLLVECRVDTPW